MDRVAIEYICNTLKYDKWETVSLGSAVESYLNGRKLSFEDNIVTGHKRIDEYSLRSCKFLSVRGSSLHTINCTYLQRLLYIDIAFCKIEIIHLYDCSSL